MSVSAAPAALRLGAVRRGFRGRITTLAAEGAAGSLSAAELERRLLEMGFVEGAEVELRHQGLFGADPIAVRVGQTTVALRRREASAVIVEPAD